MNRNRYSVIYRGQDY